MREMMSYICSDCPIHQERLTKKSKSLTVQSTPPTITDLRQRHQPHPQDGASAVILGSTPSPTAGGHRMTTIPWLQILLILGSSLGITVLAFVILVLRDRPASGPDDADP